MAIDELAIYLTKVYYPAVSKTSAFFSLIVILFMILIYIYDAKLIDRVTLRLQLGIALYDLLFHTGFLWRAPFINEPSNMCTFIAWSLIFLPLFYTFLNISIGINLQLVFLHNKTISGKVEVMYWVIPIIAALIISLPPLALGQLGYYQDSGCFISDQVDDFTSRMLDFFIIEIWLILAMIYLIIIVILVIIEINQGAQLVKKHKFFRNTSTSSKAVKSVKLMTYRILLYPITMIISQSPTVLCQILSDLFYKRNYVLDQLSIIATGLTGTLNFIAFCCDPTVHSTIKKIYLRLRFKYFINQTRHGENVNTPSSDPVDDYVSNNDSELELTNSPPESNVNESDAINHFLRCL